MAKFNIGIIGAGFVGSACEVCFSAMPDTDVLVHDKYKPSYSLRHVVLQSDILFVCLPTPMREDGSCDTSIIWKVIEQAQEHAKKSKIFVIKSTVPPGTTSELQKRWPKHKFFFNPEFLTEKNFIEDFQNQKVIYLGQVQGRDEKERVDLDAFYRAFSYHQLKAGSRRVVLGAEVNSKIVWTDSSVAETLKYATNCFLAVKVAFCNELSQICNELGVDYDEVSKLMANDDRIGKTHLQVPGPDGQYGFGGSCFPKDINALMAVARESGLDPFVLEAVWAKNLLVREKHEWEDLAQVTGNYKPAVNT